MTPRSLSMMIPLLATLISITACGKNDSKSVDQVQPPLTDFAGSYQGRDLNPRQALDEKMGRWEQVDGEWYFAPDLSLVDDSEDWEPYQHGYWSWDEEQDRGWTWVSHEPWGWMTEHYGVWRHHRRLGWIWIPFDKMEYRPHTVTWFDDGDYVGWYPYYKNYRYRQHPDFTDGYWDVNYAALKFATGRPDFRLGVTVVLRDDVTRDNVRQYRLRDRRRVHQIAYRVHHDPVVRTRIGLSPGGLSGYMAFDFIQRGSRHKAHRGHSRVVISKGGARFIQPYRHIDQPIEYRRRWEQRVRRLEKRQAMPSRQHWDRRNDRDGRDQFSDHGSDRRRRKSDQQPAELFQPQVLPPQKQEQERKRRFEGRGQNGDDRRARRQKEEKAPEAMKSAQPIVEAQPRIETPPVLEAAPIVEVPSPIQPPPGITETDEGRRGQRRDRAGQRAENLGETQGQRTEQSRERRNKEAPLE